jgi:hypothetical protein
MGNNFVCENYYCESISLKPEWFSENSWDITYDYFDNKNNNLKPYNIEKGIIKISNTPAFRLVISKKLHIDLNYLESIKIPIRFKCNLNSDLYILAIISNQIYNLDRINTINEIKSNSDELFYYQIKLNNKKITLNRSYDNKFISKKIKADLPYIYNIELNSNNNFFKINEMLVNNNKKKMINHDSIKFFYNENMYLTIYIYSRDDITNNEYIELNFD